MRSATLFILYSLLLSFISYGQMPTAIRLIDSTLDLYGKENFSGVVLVAKGTTLLYHKAFGEADKEKHIQNRIDTRFNIASMGKMLTATLILKLAEEGKIDLQKPINTYMPEYNIPNGDVITLHHLLTHTSGLSNYMLHPDYDSKKDRLYTLDSVMPLVTDMPLSFDKPGETWRYSNSGFIVLGKLVEKITGKRYDEYLDDVILKPLSLHKIIFPRKYEAPSFAVPYYLVSATRYLNESKEESGIPHSDGGFQMTALEVYKFAEAILENKLLKEQTRSMMLSSYSKAGKGAYGYGWMLSEDFGGKNFVGHTGGTLAFSAELRMNVDDGYIVVVLSNIPINQGRIINAIMNILYTGKNPWLPKKPLANIIFEIMDEKGLDYLKDNLDTIMKKGAYPAFNNAGPFIPASEMLTKFQMYDKAIAVLQYISSKFPQDWGPYDSLGDTYKAMGDKIKAKESFQSALARNPKDEYAINQLKQLE